MNSSFLYFIGWIFRVGYWIFRVAAFCRLICIFRTDQTSLGGYDMEQECLCYPLFNLLRADYFFRLSFRKKSRVSSTDLSRGIWGLHFTNFAAFAIFGFLNWTS